jgi:uncharacterized membrane protein YGL010W
MKSLVDHLSQYAAYHRDPRNIASHFIGIPLIVVAVAVLLSRPQWAGGWLSPAVLVSLASAWFYLRLELRLGVLMTVLLGLCAWAGHALAQQSTGSGSSPASECLWWAGRFSLSAITTKGANRRLSMTSRG